MKVRRLIGASIAIFFICICLYALSLQFQNKDDKELSPDLTVMALMRDGTELPTDLYFPKGKSSKLPCILMRCPAGRQAYPWRNYAALAQYGYLVAIQDTRSSMDKEGKTIPYLADGWGEEKDGYDAVEWLAKSPFTNGRIGTIGFSAVGITQQMMAPTNPPSLKCQYIGVAAGSIYHHAVFPGGQFLKNQVEGWLGTYAKDPSILDYLSQQTHYNQFWTAFDSISMAHEVAAPAIHYGGWYDTFIQGTLDAFVSRQTKGREGARGKQKLVIGPWTHYGPDSTELGEYQVPLNAQQMPIAFSPNKWFDYYLKGEQNAVDQLPPVTYYLMGPFDGSSTSGNEWKTAQEWPVPAKQVAFYLGEQNELATDLPSFNSAEYAYRYDPNDPVPTIGGKNLFVKSGPMDQRAIEERDDVVLFTSAPLEEDLEITGRLTAKLYFSSDCDDTDIAIRFCDLYPDGKSLLIADGMVRTGLLYNQQNGELKGEHLHPRKAEIDLWSTSILIPKGHRLRVSITSSNYPRFEKNSNRGLLNMHQQVPVIANNKIHVGQLYPSRLILPVVKQ